MKVAVLMGGRSAEREVSLTTGGAVSAALRELGHEVIEIDAAAQLPQKLLEARPEVAFIALHGRWGEDGTVQGLLEIMGIPYTGSGVESSAVAMNKVVSKRIFTSFGAPTPEFQVLPVGQGAGELKLKPPFVVKPPKEGSTIGINIVTSSAEAQAAIDDARKYCDEVMVEKFVEGRELTVGVIDGEPLPIVEIEPEGGFYDYKSKYTTGMTTYTCPAKLTDEQARVVVKAGVEAFRALDCAGAARVDVLLDDDNNPWVLEVNTIPGMTPTSLLPKAAATAGMDFPALVQKMLDGASLKA